MSLNIPEDFALAAWELTASQGTQPFIVTLGLDISLATSAQAAADHAFQAYVDVILPNTFDELTLQRCTLTIPGPLGGTGTVENSGDAQPGEAVGDPASLSMAVLVNKRTDLIGRPGRGRMFLPGLLGQVDVDLGGNLETSAVGLYNTMMDQFSDELQSTDGPTADPLQPVLLHSNALLAPTPITGFSVSSKVGTLRKRIR